MSDPNLSEFYSRVARVERARQKGYGFEAEGTLGRSHYHRRVRSNRSVFRPLVLVLICAFVFKGTIHYKVGPELYQQRVDRLTGGEGFDRLGGWLMQADPVTVFVADFLRDYLPPRG